MENPNWCKNCDGNGFFYKNNVTLKCLECEGFGFVKSREDQSADNCSEDTFIDLNCSSPYPDINNENKENSFKSNGFHTDSENEIPPPPSTEVPTDLETLNKTNSENFKISHVSNWKIYQHRYRITYENLKIAFDFNHIFERISGHQKHFLRLSTKDTISMLKKTKKPVESFEEFTSNICGLFLVENNKEVLIKREENINSFLEVCANKRKELKNLKQSLRNIKKLEDQRTKELQVKLDNFKKSRKRCKNLIQKMCDGIAHLNDAEVDNNEQSKTVLSFFKKKKKPEKINKKLLKLKSEAHLKSSDHEDLIIKVNEAQNEFFEIFLPDLCDQLEKLELLINNEKESLYQAFIELNKIIKSFHEEFEDTAKAQLEKVTNQKDTEKYTEKLKKQVGDLNREDYLLHYDLSLMPEDILDN